MTLTTTIYVRGQVEPREAVDVLRAALGAGRTVPVRYHEGNGEVDIDHPRGMGLPAWMLSRWGIHRQPLLDQPAELPEEPNEGKGIPPAYGVVSLDSAYRTDGAQPSAEEVHAGILRVFGAFLATRGVPWSWGNDMDDELHDGFHGLDDLEGVDHAAA